MEQYDRNELPEVSLCGIGPKEAKIAASLLTPEAVSMIQRGEALGLALEEEGEARAAVCARLSPENETVLEIISLYVIPEYRRRGLGSTLLLELLDLMMESTDASLHFVTASFLEDDQAMSAMLSKLGFEIEQDETALSWRLPLGEVPNSFLMQKKAALPPHAMLFPLEKLSNHQIHQLVYTLSKHHADLLGYEQIRQAHQQASFVLLNEEAEAVACAIFSAADASHVALTQFFTAYKNAGPSMAVLQASAEVLLKQFPSETVLEIPTLSTSTSKLVQTLLPESKAVCLNHAVLDLTRE